MKLPSKWFKGHLRRTIIILVLVTLANIFILGSILIRHNGRLMIDVGTDEMYLYSYEQSTGTYRINKESKEYEKISEFAPASKDEFFMSEDSIIFTSRKDYVVKINLLTLDEKIIDYEIGSIALKAYNTRYMILTNAEQNHNAFVVDIDSLEIVDFLHKKINHVEINEEHLEFIVQTEQKKYRYSFETRKMIEIVK